MGENYLSRGKNGEEQSSNSNIDLKRILKITPAVPVVVPIELTGPLTNFPSNWALTSATVGGGNSKPLTFEIHCGGCFTPTPSRSYVGGHVSSVDVVYIDEFCLHDIEDMVVKLGYGVANLMYYHFLRPILGLDYGLHPLNVDADVLEMAKYVNDNKIILVYVEHGVSNVDSSIFVTPKKRVAIAVDNHLRKAHIEIDSSPDVNRNLTPVCHRNFTNEWEHVSSEALSIGEVMKNLSKKQPVSSVEGPIIVKTDDPFDGFDEILGDCVNIEDEINGKQMIVHVVKTDDPFDGLDGILGDCANIEDEINGEQMIVHVEMEVDTDNETEEENVLVSMNNFSFIPDPKHDLSIVAVEVQEHDLDVIDYDSFGNDLDDGIDSKENSI
ncbi:hypothetical protein Tco_1376287 [Tanacetum coccineum]